ncbi:helix-turn-helix domain-containing protein [Nocardia flavorosea]|uniref:helix-turn-helix domain-containing protein n=1 Tax=Nocardia flavorosea TaxID=53429 RepID=UPI0007A52259|nr:helix-turn-helix transcriptional regulator [Nocardia flavorosea]
MSDHESGIGRRIAYYRARKGLSQRDFAPLIKRSEAWVSQVERGVRTVKALDVLQRIADVLEMPVAELAPSAPTARAEPIPAHVRALRLLLVTDHALAAAVAEPVARPDLDRLAEQVDDIWTCAHQARYAELHTLLEALLPHLETASATTDSGRADELLAATCQVWAVALAELQQFDAAWAAAERAMRVAQRRADPVLMAACAYRRVIVFQRGQRLDLARQTADSARAALEVLLELPASRAPVVYGALTLQSAIIAARVDDAELVRELLDSARKTASAVGADREEYRVEFGPTAVALHEVAAAVELGDAGVAIRLAARIDTDRLPDFQRARLLADTARAWAQRRRPDQALALLLDAEALAPEYLARQRSVRSTTVDLLSMDPGTPGLAEFARRIGVDAPRVQPPEGRKGTARTTMRAARGPRTP